MTLNELARLVLDMRNAQRRYFKHRQHDDLERSEVLERQLDEAVRRVLEPSLFDAESYDAKENRSN